MTEPMKALTFAINFMAKGIAVVEMRVRVEILEDDQCGKYFYRIVKGQLVEMSKEMFEDEDEAKWIAIKRLYELSGDTIQPVWSGRSSQNPVPRKTLKAANLSPEQK
jgi:hypothetical protein